MATDEERIYVYQGEKYVGWIWAVYGNSGWDVVSDYTIRLEELGLMAEVQKVIDAEEAKACR